MIECKQSICTSFSNLSFLYFKWYSLQREPFRKTSTMGISNTMRRPTSSEFDKWYMIRWMPILRCHNHTAFKIVIFEKVYRYFIPLDLIKDMNENSDGKIASPFGAAKLPPGIKSFWTSITKRQSWAALKFMSGKKIGRVSITWPMLWTTSTTKTMILQFPFSINIINAKGCDFHRYACFQLPILRKDCYTVIYT